MKLKQHLLASALCVLPFAASAADLPVKAPPYRVVQPVPFTWTGFYVGASGGFISQNTTATDLGHSATDGMFQTTGDTYGVPGIGGIFGVNVGYNYQMGPVVLGLEADISATTVNRDISFNGGGDVVSSKLNGLGTVRGRIGYAFDHALLYATGGWAYGHVENHAFRAASTIKNVSTDDWKSGWTVGGGLEYAFLNNWTVRVEALYVDLGTSVGTNTNTCSCRFGFKNTYTLGRLGLNYKF